MFYLYILKSTQHNRNYTGVTNSVENRLKTHNSGGSKSTKPWRPWKVIHTEQFSTLSEAKKREWFLKCTPQGGKEKRKILEKAGIPAPKSRDLGGLGRKGKISKTFKFKSKVSVWGAGNSERTDDSSQWRFARVPEDISLKIKEMQKGRLRRGWGAVYARAKIGKSEWLTSVFPVPGFNKTGIPAPKDLGNWHSTTYILPLKKQIRYEENLYDGIDIKVAMEVWF